MKFSKIIILLVLGLGTISFLSACSKGSYSDDPAQQYQGYSAQQLYVEGKQALGARNYNHATTLFEALEALYPFGGLAEKAQLDLIFAYYKTGDYALAVATADQYIHIYPRSEHVDYAYYLKGLSEMYSGETWLQRAFPINMALRDLTSTKQAFYDFRDLVQLFPNSQYSPDAKQHMVYLRNLLSEHELEIAHYYYVRDAYVAAANRSSYLIRHFQHTPQVEDALVILIKANLALGLHQSAHDAYRVLQANYPTSPAVKKLAPRA